MSFEDISKMMGYETAELKAVKALTGVVDEQSEIIKEIADNINELSKTVDRLAAKINKIEDFLEWKYEDYRKSE